MKTTIKNRLRRKAKRLPTSEQRTLFPQSSLPEEPSSPVPMSVEFHCPSSETIFIGEVPLRRYLSENGMGYVIGLRKELEASDLTAFLAAYDPLGRKAIHPVIMLGLIIYGIWGRHWSLRELEQLSKRDVGAWWLCGGLQPDHSTIGKFINLHAEVLTEQYFVELTRRLLQKLRLSPGTVGGDGTVIEAAGSHYKNLKMEAARQAATAAAARAAARPQDAKAQAAATIARQVAETAVAREDHRRALHKKPDVILVSPSEPEAVNQPLKNGLRRPSYKPSVLANEQRLLVGQRVDPSDEGASLPALLAQHRQILGDWPRRTLLDAAYHTHEVLGWFVAQELDLLCPAGKADHQQWEKKGKLGKYGKHEFTYLEERDVYLCPAGRDLRFRDHRYDRLGKHYRRYWCARCDDCAKREHCTSSRTGRMIYRYDGDEWKEAMSQVFADERACRAYGQRKAYVEPVFAELRLRQGLIRFRRRGCRGASLEFALHCTAYNLKRALALELGKTTSFGVYITFFALSASGWILFGLSIHQIGNKSRLTAFLALLKH